MHPFSFSSPATTDASVPVKKLINREIPFNLKTKNKPKVDAMDLKNVQESEIFSSNKHFTEIDEKLQIHFDNQQFCDITLVSADESYKVKAHKLILSSVSKYFLVMFSGSLQESETNKVKLSQIDGRSLEAILGFIYKGIIKLTPDTVEPIIKASDILELGSLKAICIGYIIKHVDKSNCLGIVNFAKSHMFADLYSPAMTCACEHFVELRTEQEFLDLDVAQLCELISSDDLRMASEDDVVAGIMEWMNYCRDERSKFLGRLLSHVRFPFLNLACISKYTEVFTKAPEVLQILCNAFKWHVDPLKRSSEFSREQCRVRNFNDVIVTIKGCANEEKGKSLMAGLYFAGLGNWTYTKWPALPCVCKNVKYVRLAKRLIVTDQDSHAVDCLNLETMEWSEFPRLPTTKTQALMTSEGTIYAVGDGYLHMIEHPFEKWSTIEDPSIEDIIVCAAHNRQIYFVHNESVQVFNPLNKVRRNMMKLEFPKQNSNMFFGASTLNTLDCLHVVRHLDTDFLIYWRRSAGGFLGVYNIDTKSVLRRISLPDMEASKIGLHGKTILLAGSNKIVQVDIFGEDVRHLPLLTVDASNPDILL